MSSSTPHILLSIQGHLNPGAEALYQSYLAGTVPIMADFNVEIAAVGSHLTWPETPPSFVSDWQINAMLKFPSVQAVQGFFLDSRYQKIKSQFRDPAYGHLEMSLWESKDFSKPKPGSVVALFQSTQDSGPSLCPPWQIIAQGFGLSVAQVSERWPYQTCWALKEKQPAGFYQTSIAHLKLPRHSRISLFQNRRPNQPVSA